MQVTPYVDFNGRCEEALNFYRDALGAEVLFLMRFKEAPPGQPGPVSPGIGDKILHSSIRIGDSTVLASDGHCAGKTNFGGIALSLTVANDAAAERAFRALSDGGEVKSPLTRTFFSSSFGMVTDKFGVLWMVYVPQAPAKK